MLIILNQEITTLWAGWQGNRGSIPHIDRDYFVYQPTKEQLQLISKLLRSYMSQHYRVVFRELIFHYLAKLHK